MLTINTINKGILILMVSILSTLIFSGCGSDFSEKPKEDQVVAKINNYELTISDFKNETNTTLATRYLQDPIKAKEALLEDLIIKKILIQEAQKQNFDKNKAFMKEIERYWEQALLKLLIKKKEKELLLKGETSDEVQKNIEKWIDDLRNQAHVTINSEVLEKIELK